MDIKVKRKETIYNRQRILMSKCLFVGAFLEALNNN